jgi:hypothetical protein
MFEAHQAHRRALAIDETSYGLDNPASGTTNLLTEAGSRCPRRCSSLMPRLLIAHCMSVRLSRAGFSFLLGRTIPLSRESRISSGGIRRAQPCLKNRYFERLDSLSRFRAILKTGEPIMKTLAVLLLSTTVAAAQFKPAHEAHEPRDGYRPYECAITSLRPNDSHDPIYKVMVFVTTADLDKSGSPHGVFSAGDGTEVPGETPKLSICR